MSVLFWPLFASPRFSSAVLKSVTRRLSSGLPSSVTFSSSDILYVFSRSKGWRERGAPAAGRYTTEFGRSRCVTSASGTSASALGSSRRISSVPLLPVTSHSFSLEAPPILPRFHGNDRRVCPYFVYPCTGDALYFTLVFTVDGNTTQALSPGFAVQGRAWQTVSST